MCLCRAKEKGSKAPKISGQRRNRHARELEEPTKTFFALQIRHARFRTYVNVRTFVPTVGRYLSDIRDVRFHRLAQPQGRTRCQTCALFSTGQPRPPNQCSSSHLVYRKHDSLGITAVSLHHISEPVKRIPGGYIRVSIKAVLH